MNIYNIKEAALNETSGISFNIYLSGCKGYCPGCHSDHTWDFSAGSLLNNNDLVEYIKDIPDYKFDHICILGGEPLDNPKTEVIELLKTLRKTFSNKPLWLYTHFELEEVDPDILDELDYIKTGDFRIDIDPPEKDYFGVFLASHNQKIHKLK